MLIIISNYAEFTNKNVVAFTDFSNRTCAAIYRTKNILLLPNITEYTYISNITNGTASNSKVLVLDNNLDINNINFIVKFEFLREHERF